MNSRRRTLDVRIAVDDDPLLLGQRVLAILETGLHGDIKLATGLALRWA